MFARSLRGILLNKGTGSVFLNPGARFCGQAQRVSPAGQSLVSYDLVLRMIVHNETRKGPHRVWEFFKRTLTEYPFWVSAPTHRYAVR